MYEGGQPAWSRGPPEVVFNPAGLHVRVEPYVIPRKSLTGDNTERVDTRVLQVSYALEDSTSGVYGGQQLDVHVEGAKRK